MCDVFQAPTCDTAGLCVVLSVVLAFNGYPAHPAPQVAADVAQLLWCASVWGGVHLHGRLPPSFECESMKMSGSNAQQARVVMIVLC